MASSGIHEKRNCQVPSFTTLTSYYPRPGYEAMYLHRMKEGKGRGKGARSAYTLNSKLSHAARVKSGRGETNRVACLRWSSTLAGHGREVSCLQSYTPRRASGTFVPPIQRQLPRRSPHLLAKRLFLLDLLTESFREQKGRSSSCGVCPSIGSRGVLHSFDTYRVVIIGRLK